MRIEEQRHSRSLRKLAREPCQIIAGQRLQQPRFWNVGKMLPLTDNSWRIKVSLAATDRQMHRSEIRDDDADLLAPSGADQ